MSLPVNKEANGDFRSERLEAGLQFFSRMGSLGKESWSSIKLVDFASLIKQDKDLNSVLEQCDMNTLYLSIKQSDEESLGEILPYISPDQFARILDREAWTHDEISLLQVKHWLKLASATQAQAMCQRFFSLEEEFQLGALNQKVVVCTLEEYESFGKSSQDRFKALPGNELFYSFMNVSQEEEEFLYDLVERGLAYNLEYTMSLLMHAHSLPLGEQLLLALQFRKARMEEDGYADYMESLELFRPLGSREQDKCLNICKNSALDPEALRFAQELDSWEPFQGTFFDQVMETLGSRENAIEKRLTISAKSCQEQLLLLVNGLMSVCKAEPGDVAKLKAVFQGAKATLSLGLEVMSAGFRAKGVEIMGQMPIKSLFRFGQGLMRTYQASLIENLLKSSQIFSPKILKYHQEQKYSLVLIWLEQTIVGIFDEPYAQLLIGQINRFPCIPERYMHDLRAQQIMEKGAASEKKHTSTNYRLISSRDELTHVCRETRKMLALYILAKSFGYDDGKISQLDFLSYLLSYLKESYYATEMEPRSFFWENFIKEMHAVLSQNSTWFLSLPEPISEPWDHITLINELLLELRQKFDFEVELQMPDSTLEKKTDSSRQLSH